MVVALAAVLATTAHAVEDSLPLWANLATDAVVVAFTFTALKEVLATRIIESPGFADACWVANTSREPGLDVVFCPDREPRIGIVHLGSHRSGLAYYGENLDPEGRYVDHFKADDLKILFSYEEDGVGADSPLLAGIGAISFDRRDGAPGRYTGHCLDAVERIGHGLIGLRVDDPDDLARLEDPTSRAETALEIAAPLLAQAPTYRPA